MSWGWLRPAAVAVSLALAAPAATAREPHYVRRGNEVEKSYKIYTGRLEKTHAALRAALKKDAPDLYRKLSPKPPRPMAFGYQILPKLVKDPKPGKVVSGQSPDAPYYNEKPRATSTSYSWPRTEQFIGWEGPKLDEMEEKIKIMPQLSRAERRPIYERMVKDYFQMEENQRLIDSHLQYNRFWQKAIAEDKPRFDRLTLLHDTAVYRQSILDALEIKDEHEFRKLVLGLKEIDGTKPRAEIEAQLRAAERILDKRIHLENDNIKVPPYVRVKKTGAHAWEVRVPLYTDIGDRGFVGRVKQAIERVWSVRDKGDSYQVRLDVRYLTAGALYKGAKAPAPGDHLDVAKHYEHFPRDGGVLTTGVISTFAIPGKYVALGPQDISLNVMAHEFGHILGFIDGYFRGYRDKDTQGFEVLEIVPDPEDIMCTPATGRVKRFHFEKIMSGV